MDLERRERPTAVVLADRLAGHPDVLQHLVDAEQAAWASVDPVLLELCRLRVAMLLDCGPDLRARTPAAVAAGLDEATVAELALWPTSPRFGTRERAALGFTEQFVIDVGTLGDDLAFALRDELGDDGFASFVSALLVVEQRQRLRLAWSRLFGEEAA